MRVKLITLIALTLLLTTSVTLFASSSTNQPHIPTANVDDVIDAGDIFLIPGYNPTQDLLAAGIAEIDRRNTLGNDLRQGLYLTDPISYTVSNRTAYLKFDTAQQHDVQIIPILLSGNGRTMAIAGQYQDTYGRYSLFGSVPPKYFNNGESLSFQAPFTRLISWLLTGDTTNTAVLDQTQNIVIARSTETSNIQNWFTALMPNATITTCANTTPLSDCLDTADFLILGKGRDLDSALIPADIITLDTYLHQNKPLLYLHDHHEWVSDFSEAFTPMVYTDLPYGGNYWSDEAERSANWADQTEMTAQIHSQGVLLRATLQHIQDQDYAFNWEPYIVNGEVDTDAVPNYNADFGDGATQAREMLTSLDKNATAIFQPHSYPLAYRLEKILALIGDALRQDVQFPMDILTTEQNEFLRAYFADQLVYNSRDINPPQPDLGNFGRSDYSHITPITKTVTLDTLYYGKKATSAFALPGQTFEVTRNDSHSDITVEVWWNPNISGAVHLFHPGDSYNRPHYLWSTYYAIAPGQTLRLTSPYGGMIQITHSRSDDPAKTISLTFANVGQHPFYDGPEDKTQFLTDLASGDYDWAELVTPNMQVHAPVWRMVESLNDLEANYGWDVDEVARVTQSYHLEATYSFSGYIGWGLTRSFEVGEFCAAHGWDCDNPDIHIYHGQREGTVLDQNSCNFNGGACSTWPVAGTWNWNPIGGGQLHEIGHHIEGNSGASYQVFGPMHWHYLSNIWRMYVPYRYYKDSGNLGNCSDYSDIMAANETLFNDIVAAASAADRQQYLNGTIWNSSNYTVMTRSAITQMVAHAHAVGGLNSGWDYLTLYLTMAREFDTLLDGGEAVFDASKALYGFDTYSFAEAKAVVTTQATKTSWALVAYSLITGHDQRNYFTMLGFEYDAKSAAQVASFNLPMAPEQFYALGDICSVDEAIPLPLSDNWPTELPYAQPFVWHTVFLPMITR